MTSSFPPPPPPARNFHGLSMVPHSNGSAAAALLTPPTPTDSSSLSPPGAGKARPLSGTSSIASEASNATDATSKQSVNDILSLAAEAEGMSVYSMDTDLNAALEGGVDGGGALSFQALMRLDPAQAPAADPAAVLPPPTAASSAVAGTEQQIAQSLKNPALEIMGSVTSVATVQGRGRD